MIPPKIDVRGLHKAFGGKPVLRGVDLAVAPGESVVIMGGSGSGKSVLIKHMIGLLVPDRGTVSVDGTALTGRGTRDWIAFRRRCGFAFQEGALFDSMNVFDNIAFPLRRHTKLPAAKIRERVAECLATVHLEGVERKATNELSGGMRRRVGFARAIAMKPEILFFDEPHTGLDPLMTAVIDRDIHAMRESDGITVVTITHDVRSAFRIADRIAMLRDGRIALAGTPDDLRASDDPYVRKFLAGEPLDGEEVA